MQPDTEYIMQDQDKSIMQDPIVHPPASITLLGFSTPVLPQCMLNIGPVVLCGPATEKKKCTK